MPEDVPLQEIAAPARHPLHRSLLRVRSRDGQVAGAAFFAGDDWICTCAHVVAEALGAEDASPDQPDGDVHLDFYDDGTRVIGQVVCWIPARAEGDDISSEPEDIALLKLAEPAVRTAAGRQVRLLAPRHLAGHRFEACGFPDGVPNGAWAHGVFSEQRGNGTFQIESPGPAGFRVQPGFSGAPVWDERERGVVGMVVSSWRDPLARAAFVVPVQMLVAATGDRLRVLRSDDRPFAALTGGLSNPRPLTEFLVSYMGTAQHPAAFGGRHAELTKLDRWLGDPGRPYQLVVAPAGWGKSTLLAHWAREVAETGRAKVVLAPISLRFGTNQRADVEEMMLDRVRYLLPDAGPVSKGDLASVLSQERDSAESPLLLVFDSIDEASGWRPERELPLPLFPAPGIRVLISARELPDRNAAEWLAALGWPGRADTMTLGALNAEGIRDVLLALGVTAADPEALNALAAALYDASDGGDPLLVGIFATAIGPGGFVRPDQLPDLTGGLSRYFDLWWEAQRQQWISEGRDTRSAAERATMLFDVLASALGPLTRDELSGLTGIESGAVLDEHLNEFGRWVIAVAGDGRRPSTYAFAHPRLGTYWREQKMTARERERVDDGLLHYCQEQLHRLRAGADPATASPYALRYYVTHLENEQGDYALFDELVCPEWWQAHRAVSGSDEPFLRDLWAAWERAEEVIETVSDEDNELAGELTGRVFRYMLVATSLQSLSSNVPGALIVRLVAADPRIWTVQWALVQARRHTQRFKVLAALAPHLPEDERVLAVGEAFTAARAIRFDHDRAEALADLVPWLPAERLGEVLTAAWAIPFPRDRSMVLKALVPRLSDQLLGEAWDVVEARGLEDWDAEVLAVFAPRLPKQRLSQALRSARAIDKAYSRAAVLTAISPQLPVEQRTKVLGEALDAAQMVDESWRPGLFAALAPQLAGKRRGRLLADAVSAAQRIEDLRHKVEALAALAPWLPEDKRMRVLNEALNTAETIKEPEWRAGAFAALTPWLPEALRNRFMADVFHAARTIGDEHWQAEALAALAPHLSKGQLGEALIAAQTIREQSNHAGALAALAPWLPEELSSQAVQAALTIDDQGYRAEVLEALAPQLPDEMLGEALSAAQAINDQEWHTHALVDLAPHVPEEQRARVLREALKAARAVNDDDARVIALANVAEQLPEELRPRVLSEALSTAEAIGNEFWLPRMLAALAPQLEGELLDQALSTAQMIKDDRPRAEALAALAPQLSDQQRASVLGAALAAAQTAGSQYTRADVIEALAPQLPPELLAQALNAAQTVEADYTGAHVLEVLAPRLSAKLSGQALSAAQKITDSTWRAMAMTALVPRLPDHLLGQVLHAAENADRPNWRANLLAALAPRLPVPSLGQALSIAETIDEPSSLASALVALAPRLPEKLLGEALSAAEAISDEDSRTVALAALANRLPDQRRMRMLGEVLSAALAISNKYTRAKVLAALTPQLPSSLVGEALNAAQAIGDENARVMALAALAPRLADDQRASVLADALNATKTIDLEIQQAEAWSRLAPLLATVPLHLRSRLSSQFLRIAASGSRVTVSKNWPLFSRLIVSFGVPACSIAASALIAVPDCYSSTTVTRRPTR